MRDQACQIVVETSSWLEATTAASLTQLETGGILTGWRHSAGIYVSRFIEVPDSSASRASYLRRHTLATEHLENLIESLPEGPPIGYVGEWHTHPGDQGPSRTDRNQLKRISKKLRSDIALIILVQDHEVWKPVAICARFGRVHPATVEIERSPALQEVSNIMLEDI